MHADRTHLWKGHSGAGPVATGGRRYVARKSATGLRVLVHHSYGRMSRLAPAPQARGALSDTFEGPEQAAVAIAHDALRRAPEPELCAELAQRLDGLAPRIELDEEEIRSLARSVRPARKPDYPPLSASSRWTG